MRTANVFVSDGNYLEVGTPFDPNEERGKVYAEFLAKREGVMQFGLKVASIDEAVEKLRAAGLPFTKPNARIVQLVGKKAPEQPSFWMAAAEPVSTSLPFFIQYRLSTMPSRPTDLDTGVAGISWVTAGPGCWCQTVRNIRNRWVGGTPVRGHWCER